MDDIRHIVELLLSPLPRYGVGEASSGRIVAVWKTTSRRSDCSGRLDSGCGAVHHEALAQLSSGA
jgi:hypothetical protein